METEAEIAYNKGRQTVIRMLGKFLAHNLYVFMCVLLVQKNAYSNL